MSEQAYTELLSAFCEHVQAANSADILEHGNLHRRSRLHPGP